MKRRRRISKVEDVHEHAVKMTDALRVAREEGRVTPSATLKGRTMAERLNKVYGWNLSGDAGVRELVNHARTLGLPIGGDGMGYFFATNSAEMSSTIADLKSRIAKISQALHGCEKCARKMGQIEAELFQTTINTLIGGQKS